MLAASNIALDEQRRYQLYLEAQPRLGDDLERVATVQGRAALGYMVDESFGFHLGYAWTPLFYDSQYHRIYRDEHRIWQQVLYRYDLWNIQWQHRVRQEQRFIAPNDEVGHRSRYQLRGSYRLTVSYDSGVTVWDEVMVNLNDVQNAAPSGYDRNRIFLGPYWQIDNARYEVGYLGEHLKRFGSNERWASALLLAVTFNF